MSVEPESFYFMQIHESALTDRTFRYTEHSISLPPEATEQMLKLLTTWQSLRPLEDTYVSRTHKVSTLWARLDGIWDSASGLFRIYEIQAGSAWLGYTSIVNPEFKKNLDMLLSESWPHFRLLIHEQKLAQDELLWLRSVDVSEALATDALLRIRPATYAYLKRTQGEDACRSVRTRAVSTLRGHEKSYDMALGLWNAVTFRDTDSGERLPWNSPFVLKPVRGFGSKDIMLWKPKERAGSATRSQIVRALHEHESMFLQEYIQPDTLIVNGLRHNVIHRPFFGYDTRHKKWIPMHGVWTARPAPNLRIHGASDAVSGPLYVT